MTIDMGNDAARAAYTRLLAAYGEGTTEALAAVVAPTVRYVIHGRARLSGTYEGIKGMLTWMRLAGKISEGSVRFIPETIATDVQEHSLTVLAIGRVVAFKRGDHLEAGHLYHLRWVDDLLVEGHTYPTDQEEFDTLWS